MSPAESAADLPLSFLFNSERVNRLVQQELINGYGFTDMASSLINATFKSVRKAGMHKAIQMQTEQILLTYLLASSIDEQLSYPARAKVSSVLQALKFYLEGVKKTTKDSMYLAHLTIALDRFKSPERAKPTVHLIPPPGSPIGCEDNY